MPDVNYTASHGSLFSFMRNFDRPKWYKTYCTKNIKTTPGQKANPTFCGNNLAIVFYLHMLSRLKFLSQSFIDSPYTINHIYTTIMYSICKNHFVLNNRILCTTFIFNFNFYQLAFQYSTEHLTLSAVLTRGTHGTFITFLFFHSIRDDNEHTNI